MSTRFIVEQGATGVEESVEGTTYNRRLKTTVLNHLKWLKLLIFESDKSETKKIFKIQ